MVAVGEKGGEVSQELCIEKAMVLFCMVESVAFLELRVMKICVFCVVYCTDGRGLSIFLIYVCRIFPGH